jgi:hypothetical protein
MSKNMKINNRKKVSSKKKYFTPYEKNISKVDLDNLGGWAISEDMIKWIINNIPFNSIILELGSGLGTIELSKFYNVHTVEHDEKWLNKTDKVKYIFAPLVDKWYDVEILKKELPKQYDLLIIDGPIHEKRLNILHNLTLFDFTGIIIIDDTNREGDYTMSLKIAEIYSKKITRIKNKEKEFTILS